MLYAISVEEAINYSYDVKCMNLAENIVSNKVDSTLHINLHALLKTKRNSPTQYEHRSCKLVICVYEYVNIDYKIKLQHI